MIDKRSLAWRLAWRLFGANVAIVVALVSIISVVGWLNDRVVDTFGGRVAEVIEQSIRFESGGRMLLSPTSELRSWHNDYPSNWFVVRSGTGALLRFGNIPTSAEPLARALELNHGFWEATYWRSSDSRPSMRFLTIGTAGGKVTALVGVGTRLTLTDLMLRVIPTVIGALLPIIVILSVIFAILVAISISSALNPLRDIVGEADRIDVDRRDLRLCDSKAPTEISPIIAAFNRILQRLDKGYSAWARFIADAAHEIRTPVAVLQTRIDGLPPGPEQQTLKHDVERLAQICEQLLDLQQLSHEPLQTSSVDLSDVARQAAADIAPMILAAGRDLSVQDDGGHKVSGNDIEIARALFNLLTNALRHGEGAIVLRVTGQSVAVEDQGKGIPREARLDVLVPFRKLGTQTTGAGLGLAIVQEIMRRHGGAVLIDTAPSGGARVTLRFGEPPRKISRA